MSDIRISPGDLKNLAGAVGRLGKLEGSFNAAKLGQVAGSVSRAIALLNQHSSAFQELTGLDVGGPGSRLAVAGESLSGAARGAQLGMLLGPKGAAVGALLGATAGGVIGSTRDERAMRQAMAEQLRENQQFRAKQEFDRMRGEERQRREQELNEFRRNVAERESLARMSRRRAGR